MARANWRDSYRNSAHMEVTSSLTLAGPESNAEEHSDVSRRESAIECGARRGVSSCRIGCAMPLYKCENYIANRRHHAFEPRATEARRRGTGEAYIFPRVRQVDLNRAGQIISQFGRKSNVHRSTPGRYRFNHRHG